MKFKRCNFATDSLFSLSKVTVIVNMTLYRRLVAWRNKNERLKNLTKSECVDNHREISKKNNGKSEWGRGGNEKERDRQRVEKRETEMINVYWHAAETLACLSNCQTADVSSIILIYQIYNVMLVLFLATTLLVCITEKYSIYTNCQQSWRKNKYMYLPAQQN